MLRLNDFSLYVCYHKTRECGFKWNHTTTIVLIKISYGYLFKIFVLQELLGS